MGFEPTTFSFLPKIEGSCSIQAELQGHSDKFNFSPFKLLSDCDKIVLIVMQDFRTIERKWQREWEKAKIFESDIDRKKKKFFITIPYPYMNGEPHIGNAFTWFRGDTYARFKRMQGFNVLLPQGFHATGEPILGVVERLKNKDPDQISTVKLYGATDKDIENFVKLGPEFVAKFWMQRWIEVLKMAGISIDWRRTFVTALNPAYNKFIEWQYNTLRKKGYVTRGTHPVVWCPHDQSPTGDHDRLKGEGESPIEYSVLKFKLDSGEILPCATLRPETVYGATNLWINPTVEYLWANVDGEVWLVSKEASEKLKDQLHEVKIIGKVSGRSLVGKFVENPVLKNRIIVLPADFVDPLLGTGVVMSVPAHAPYDWIALRELQKDYEVLAEFRIDKKLLDSVKPVSIISVEGFGEYPAVEIAEKMLIQSQEEREKLDKATSEIYKKEYHLGILKKNVQDYAGKKVSDVKEEMMKDFVSKKIASTMWELTGEVICRCKARTHVKILENQWFLKFSDERWKELVRSCIAQMRFYPEEARVQFLNTVDWLKDKACARKSGLGTKLPWDKEWIVETLSDSTIYMAYYTISHIIAKKKIPADKLTDSFFNFVLLGKGVAQKVSEETGIDKKILNDLREEFEYFYPVDLRTTAKDLLQNHMTFFLFHHVAIWKKKYWPKNIAISGFVNVGGQKMSKRFGNVIVLRDLLRKIGSDLTRVNIISANENMDDADWREEDVESFRDRINFVWSLAKILKKCERKNILNHDRFLLSKMQSTIKNTTSYLEIMRFRSASQEIFFNAVNDLKWYLSRCVTIKNCNGEVLKNYLENLVRMMSPFVPHISEEIWKILANKNFVALETWPLFDKKQLSLKSELAEDFVKKIIDDVRQIEKIRGIKPREIVIIVAGNWKFEIYKKLLKLRGKDLKNIFSTLKIRDKEKLSYVQNLYKKMHEFPEEILESDLQIEILNEGKEFLEKTLGATVKIETEEESTLEKKKSADIMKPAIFLAAA